MKTIEKFLRQNPSYTKWGSKRLAERTKLAVTTIERFKRTNVYREIKNQYIKGL